MLVWRYGVLAAVIAAVINAIIWLIARALGVSFRVQPPGQTESTVNLLAVILITIVPILLGVGVYVLLHRVTRRPFLVFLIIALVVFVLSLLLPLSAADETGTQVTRILMHIVATLAVLAGVYRFEQQRTRL
ncbi:MAG: DUF6069 family protein [Thermomicrobium sp.]|nr:DUF6069 family protein [Thermomicrobium sp.]MDW8006547.1 DUF6069 family protein [Thermomicrobium sp.]